MKQKCDWNKISSPDSSAIQIHFCTMQLPVAFSLLNDGTWSCVTNLTYSKSKMVMFEFATIGH